MKTVLLGYMGSGKSTVAKLLAKALNLPFIDLDDYIEGKEQRSIKSIFDDKGEIYFRLQESKCLNEVLTDKAPGIVALGGGTPCYANNMELIRAMSNSFYLKGSIATIKQRLSSEKAKRPLIASLSDEKLTEFIAKHLFERRNFYEQAHHTVVIDAKSPQEIADELINMLQPI